MMERDKKMHFVALGVQDTVKEELDIITGGRDENLIQIDSWQELPERVDDVLAIVCRLSKA